MAISTARPEFKFNPNSKHVVGDFTPEAGQQNSKVMLEAILKDMAQKREKFNSRDLEVSR